MKISVGIMVINGRPFMKAQLDNLYDLAHEIVICEGGTDKWFKTHGFRRSNDGTLDIIKNYPDPDNKIKLIQRDWRDKNEMSKAYCKEFTGDVIYIVSIDEFITPENIKLLSSKIMSGPYTAASAGHYVFFGDFDTIVVSKKVTGFWCDQIRFFRYNPDYFIQHLPFGLAKWENPSKARVVNVGKRPWILDGTSLGVTVHHYSYVDIQASLQKLEFYVKRGMGKVDPRLFEALKRFESERQELIDNDFIIRNNRTSGFHYLVDFEGEHFPLIDQIKEDLEDLKSDRLKITHETE